MQRFLCRDCGKTFTFTRAGARPRGRFTEAVTLEAVRLYVQGLSSYRTLAVLLSERLGVSVSRFTLNGWVDEIGGRALTPLEASARLRPRWGGILGVDGKTIFIRGQEATLLVAVDQTTQDVVHRLVLEGGETGDAFHQLLRETVLTGGYRLRGLIIDGVPSWIKVWADYFRRVPLQLCRVHAERRIDRQIPKLRRSAHAPLQAEFKDAIHGILFAEDEDTALERYYEMTADARRWKDVRTRSSRARIDVLTSLRRSFGLYMIHHHHPGIPADTNITENVIKQLNKKIRLMEGFSTVESAERFTRLLIACYRFKRFTDSNTYGHNGHSPLELAGVDHDQTDWLRFLLDTDDSRPRPARLLDPDSDDNNRLRPANTKRTDLPPA